MNRLTSFWLALACLIAGSRPVGGEETLATSPAPSGILSEKNPIEGLLKSSLEQMEAGNPREARRDLKRFIRKNPTSPQGWTLLARTYLATGAYGKAMRRFNKALKFAPHDSAAYWGRGEIYEKRGQLDEAVNEYRAAAISDPTSETVQKALARLSAHAPAE